MPFQKTRRIVGWIVGLGWTLLNCASANAQDLPTRPVRIIVPFVAGSSIDARMRMMAPVIGERIGQQIIVENRPGAGGSIGAAAAAQSAPDGSTWLFTNNSFAINAHVYKNPGYDALKSFVPLNRAYVSALVLVVNSDFKARSLKELVAIGKENPEALTYGSSGMGSLPHFAGELLFHLAGVKSLHIPFKGDTQTLSEILGGRVTLTLSGIASAQAHIKSGRLRALAVTSPQRATALPNVPTMAEAGYPAYDDAIWTGFFLPAATPKPMVERLNREITAALSVATLKERMEATGADAAPMTLPAYTAFVQNEMLRYAKLVKLVGLKLE
jgi:tripartite-type tricarboxylate transporter receptor subunit TctC